MFAMESHFLYEQDSNLRKKISLYKLSIEIKTIFIYKIIGKQNGFGRKKKYRYCRFTVGR